MLQEQLQLCPYLLSHIFLWITLAKFHSQHISHLSFTGDRNKITYSLSLENWAMIRNSMLPIRFIINCYYPVFFSTRITAHVNCCHLSDTAPESERLNNLSVELSKRIIEPELNPEIPHICTFKSNLIISWKIHFISRYFPAATPLGPHTLQRHTTFKRNTGFFFSLFCFGIFTLQENAT